MTDIEIPQPEDRHFRYRLFEILPGVLSWSILLLPFVLSFFNPTLAAFFIIGYLLVYFVRQIVGVDIRALQGYRRMRQHMQYDWPSMLHELETGKVPAGVDRPAWHFENIQRLQAQAPAFQPSELINVAMVATVNESREVLEPTLEALVNAHYNTKQIIFVIAYEGRAGQETEERVMQLLKDYGHHFRHAMAVRHPADIPGEIIGKGGNVTYAGRELQKYLEHERIDPRQVIVTTLDADNRPHPSYFAALSYTYCAAPDPIHVSYQPIVMYTNNIWDVPAPMRVLATGFSFWDIMMTGRTHLLRNFSSHAQSMQTIIDTNFWSVRTIVEDGHQFWRTYFRYDGNHEVYPIYLPVYQDAVLARGYFRTLKAQFIQLRRWTYGASDVAYVADKGFFTKNDVPKRDLFIKFLRILESHVNWAIGPPLLLYSGYVPALFHPQNYTANLLPIVVSRVQEIALAGALASVFICFKTLPPKPERYKRRRTLLMVIQWVYLPVVGLAYSSAAALYSQTRLMFGWYIGKFDVTEKAVVTADNKKMV